MLNLHVLYLGQHDWKSDELFYTICESMEEEVYPPCLVFSFHTVQDAAQLFPSSSSPCAKYACDLFEILSRYFPIHNTHPKGECMGFSREEPSKAVFLASSSAPFFEPSTIPWLIDKLYPSPPLTKVESFKYISYCASNKNQESDKATSFEKIVIEKIVYLMSYGYPAMPLLKIRADYEIGITRESNMLRIIRKESKNTDVFIELSKFKSLNMRNGIQRPLNLGEEELKVADLIDEDSGWDVSKLPFCLRPKLISVIETIPRQTEHDTEDSIRWRDSAVGEFSSKSVLRMIQKPKDILRCADWNWKIPNSSRVKLFLWQISHNRLPTSEYLHQRNIWPDPSCPLRGNGIENIDHLMCKYAAALKL
ncbi:hypothetical protein ACH5RR_019221 [Cinchona calisaya]|uniref:MMS19 nucleotide excision repair protein n=1 Tax=Cinchona calisaya TaxID=153742 RepID=A0ABD2ZSD7_9GENT